MRTEIIIGGSHGIGLAYLKKKIESTRIINISRTKPDLDHENLTHHEVDILKDDLPDVDCADALIYFPGSINLKPFNSLSEDDFRNDFEINVMGAVKAIKKYSNLLKKGQNASITLFSTVAVAQGMPFHASVAVAKAGVEGLTKSLAAEFVTNIRVNCLALNITDTPLAEKILRNEKARESIAERQPMKRILTSDEVADSVMYLVDKAVGMTGQIVGLDMGLSTIRV
ncbi:MAG: SDR family oxidoreductase [Cyclobacteriaceae bacterium]